MLMLKCSLISKLLRLEEAAVDGFQAAADPTAIRVDSWRELSNSQKWVLFIPAAKGIFPFVTSCLSRSINHVTSFLLLFSYFDNCLFSKYGEPFRFLPRDPSTLMVSLGPGH